MYAMGMTISTPPRNSTVQRIICTWSRGRPPVGLASSASLVGRTPAGTSVTAVIPRPSAPRAVPG